MPFKIIISYVFYSALLLVTATQFAFAQTDDILGARQKKELLTEIMSQVPQKGMPTSANPADSNVVYVYLVARTNTTVQYTNIFPVSKYSDDTWAFAKEIIKNYAQDVGIPIEKTTLVGYFNKFNDAQQNWNNFQKYILAYGIRGQKVNYGSEQSLAVKTINLGKNPQSAPAKINNSQRGTRTVNLPEINITAKNRITLGIMPIIDTATNLSQQFTIYQFLADNPLVINAKDTLYATLTDTRTFTYFAVSGTADERAYNLKVWQKDKLLAELSYDYPINSSVEKRLELLAKQIGEIIGSNEYSLPSKLSLKNIHDKSNLINQEINASTPIYTLFPHKSIYYVPLQSSFFPNEELKILGQRVRDYSSKLKEYNPVVGAQLVRAIYSQQDEGMFFYSNTNVPEKTKASVRKLTQPTSRRLGAALSYLAAGYDFKKDNQLDAAASAFYSALLLAHNVTAGAYEKTWLKRAIYQNMAEITEKRNQPLLASLFTLAAELNDSFLKTDFCQKASQEYYINVSKLAESCTSIEQTARDIRAQNRGSLLVGLLGAATSIGAQGGLSNMSTLSLLSTVGELGASLNTGTQASAALQEIAEDVSFDPIETKDNEGVVIELNQLFLAREIVSHLVLRQDVATVAELVNGYATDKPNLQYRLEDYLAETDKAPQALNDFLAQLRFVETQANLYESRGRKVPIKVSQNF